MNKKVDYRRQRIENLGTKHENKKVEKTRLKKIF